MSSKNTDVGALVVFHLLGCFVQKNAACVFIAPTFFRNAGDFVFSVKILDHIQSGEVLVVSSLIGVV